LRLVMVDWKKSLVRDAAWREIVFGLDLTHRELFEW